jgi:hypothetical protein
VDEWAQLADKHNRKLRKENEVLAKIAAITQEAALNNDQRYAEAVSALKAQLEYTGLYRSSDTPTMGYVREAIADIQDRLAEIQTTSQRQADTRLTNIRSAMEAEVTSHHESLEAARVSGQNTTAKWLQLCKELQQKLGEVLQATDAEYERHKSLSRNHQRLRIENDAQADDAVLLARQWGLVSAEHHRLKERVQELELQLAAPAPDARSSTDQPSESDLSPRRPQSTTLADLDRSAAAPGESAGDHAERLEAALHRGQALLATEQQALDAVRRAHLNALRQRTELEVYLRCAVLRHQQHLQSAHYAQRLGRSAQTTGYEARAATASSTSRVHAMPPGETSHAAAVATSFTAEDRRTVIESLLSVPRVLELLYQGGQRSHSAQGSQESEAARVSTLADLKAVGASRKFLDKLSASVPDPDEDEVMKMHGSDQAADEAALTQLWHRWERWTTNANADLESKAAAAAAAAAYA